MSEPGIEPNKRGRPARKGVPTVRDVALRAGVGIATVSRVLNRSTLVTAAKTNKVLQVIQEIGYKPSPLGKRAAKQKRGDASDLKHRAVCLLLIGHRTLRWIMNYAPVYAYAIESIEMALRGMDVNCMIRNVQTPAELESLKGMKVDGFLIHGASDWNEWPAELVHYPCVGVLGVPGSGWGDVVTHNNDSTGKLAANYLLSQGCRHAVIVGVIGAEVFSVRRNVFSQAMAAAGATVSDLSRDNLIQYLNDRSLSNEEDIRACVDQILQMSPRPTGIFITADVVAPPIYRELERRGLTPGVDIQIVSCNNERPYLNQLKTQPAVVDIQSGAIGSRAVESLFWRLKNPEAPRQSILVEPILQLPPVEQEIVAVNPAS